MGAPAHGSIIRTADRVPQISLILPVFSSCRKIFFAVACPDERTSLTRVLAGENLPANRAHATGETVWLIDARALREEAGGQ
jgi:6-phosphogluconolactonase